MKPVSAEDLRQTICPKAFDVIKTYLLIAAVIVGLGGGLAVIAYRAWQDGNWLKVFEFGGLGLGMTMITILVGMFEIQKVKLRNFIKEQRLAALSDYLLMALADEISQTELRYRTFYFLDRYVYFPHAGALIHYDDIAKWRTIRDDFYGFTQHVWVEITETDGFVQRISIRNRRRYLKEADRVISEMEQRKWGGYEA